MQREEFFSLPYEIEIMLLVYIVPAMALFKKNILKQKCDKDYENKNLDFNARI